MKNLQSKRNNKSIFNLNIYLYSALITDGEQISIGKILCEFVSEIKRKKKFFFYFWNII
jgi:hypothetical protein